MLEKIYYNAINEVLAADYKKIGAIWERYGSWLKGWLEIASNFNKINPEDLWQFVIDQRIKLALIDDADYPPKLKEIPGAPFGVYIKGSAISSNKKIAIVGTRRATP